MTHRSGKQTAGAVAAAIVLAFVWSCASPEADLGDDPGTQDPTFTPNGDSGGAAQGEGGDASVLPTLSCVATTCPAPYTTCPAGAGATYKCAVDPRSDKKHCGACGNECLTFEPIHMTSRCVEGACQLECLSLPRYIEPHGEAPTKYRNCNNLLDDGCEADLFSDRENCGACGNVCPGNQPCVLGACGCPDGLEACNGLCVDTSSNEGHCGACNDPCPFGEPDPCDPMPENAVAGCVSGECGKLKCGASFDDCNHDIGLGCASDGCETNIATDTNNCGACGRKCKAGEECREEQGVIDCRPTCAASGRVQCSVGCVDLLNDPDNCGGCNLYCPFATPNQQRTCEKGVCVVKCADGYGDCNGDPSDGCETDLRVHPANCGACGATCDLAAGQPCVEGQCLRGPCTGTVPK